MPEFTLNQFIIKPITTLIIKVNPSTFIGDCIIFISPHPKSTRMFEERSMKNIAIISFSKLLKILVLVFFKILFSLQSYLNFSVGGYSFGLVFYYKLIFYGLILQFVFVSRQLIRIICFG